MTALRRHPWLSSERLGALVFIAAAIAVVAATVVFNVASTRAAVQPSPTALSLAVAALLYASSHALRIVRLTIVTGNPGVSLRQIGLVHLVTAAASIVTPLKLGELFRIAELGHLVRGMGYALVVVWMERAFDSAAICLLIALATMAQPPVLAQIQPLVIVSIAFVATTLALFTIVPEGLATTSLFIVRRYEGPSAVRALRAVHWLRQGIALGPRMVAGKVATLAVLTAAIWGLELATLWWALPHADQDWRSLLTGLPMFLSSGSLEGLFLVGSGPRLPYGFVVTGTLLFLGTAAVLLYAPVRLRGLLGALRPRAMRSSMTR